LPSSVRVRRPRLLLADEGVDAVFEHPKRHRAQGEDRVMAWLQDGAEFNARQALEAGLIDAISSAPILPPG